MESHSITTLFQAIAGCRLLVIGDFMLDRTIYGQANRISPEAPTPVIVARDTQELLGGAGNVVRNVESLGGKIWCAAVVGDDQAGLILERELSAVSSCVALRIVREQGRKTTLKTRVVAVHPGQPEQAHLQRGHQQVLRIDEETLSPIATETAQQILEFSAAAMGDVDGVVISDYAKGALPRSLLRQVIGAAQAARKPVFVDPKGRDWVRYRGASVLTANAVEAEAVLGIRLSAFDDSPEGAWEELARDRVSALGLNALLITRGAEGVSLVDSHGLHHFPTSTRDVFDVTGAGDTLLAAFSLAACSGADFPTAAQMGNLAAGVAVGKTGAAAVYPSEVEHEFGIRHYSAGTKIRTLDELTATVQNLRRDNKKIVFTNGCFDLLHVGHMHLLSEAKKLGDVLIVGMNSDASVKRLKGDSRPIVSAADRAFAMTALESVDYLVIFEEPDPMELLRRIRPDVLVKGDQYAESQVVGADFIKGYGGVIGRIPIRKGISTTELVRKIRSVPA